MYNYVVRGMSELGCMLIYCIGAARIKTVRILCLTFTPTVNLQWFALFRLGSGASFLWLWSSWVMTVFPCVAASLVPRELSEERGGGSCLRPVTAQC